jgi:hypothetical protein
MWLLSLVRGGANRKTKINKNLIVLPNIFKSSERYPTNAHNPQQMATPDEQ